MRRSARSDTSSSPYLASRPVALVLLGEEQVREGVTVLGAGEAQAFQFRARATGTAQSIRVYLGSRNSATGLVAGLYASFAGHPGGLVTSGSLARPQPGAWNAVPVSSASLLSGATYWLAVLGSGGQLRIRVRREGTCSAAATALRSTALSSPWRTSAVGSTCPISGYVTGTAGVPQEPKLEEPIAEVPPAAEPPKEEPPKEQPPKEELPKEQPPKEEPPKEEPPKEEPPKEQPPAAPVDTSAPSISGTALEGQTLSASSGNWTGSPTSFSYQWQDCDALGASCTNVAGATGSSYALVSADVGHTVRVSVTASNVGGGTSASSAATLPVAGIPPLPPLDTAAPAITGSAAEAQTLNASRGTWTGSPTSFSYQWQDCNTLGLLCSNIAGATASTYVVRAADVGQALRVIVTAAGAGGSTQAPSAQTATVLPAPPVEIALPAISGSPVSGQALAAGTGSWSGSPSSFAYQWQRCGSTGGSCAAVGGASSSSYALGSADVGHTMRVQVTAVNAGGSRAATSAASAVVSEAAQASGCFASPESCGYPGTADTGANCSSLMPSGSITASTNGQKIENVSVAGTITVTASRVTINNVCVTTNGGASLGSAAVFLAKGATETTITNSTIRGENETGHSVEEALSNNYANAGASASKVQLYNCGECLHQSWTLTRSYVDVNGMKGTSDHYEDWYYSDATVVASEDTLLNPEEQTAVLFGDTHVGGGGPCDNHVTVTNSLVAGGGALFYPCGNASSVGTSTMTIKNNRFARCLGTRRYEPESGGTLCAGGADLHGYFPFGGFFMTAAYIYGGSGQVWEGNLWDDNNEVAAP